MIKVIWTEPALIDLKEIIEHIALDSPAYAEQFGTRLVEAPRRLEDFPHLDREVPECNNDTIRELICGSYRFIYKLREGACYIVSVIHGSRNLIRHLPPGDWDLL